MKTKKQMSEKKWEEMTWEERVEENNRVINEMKQEDLKIINENFTYELSKVVCKHCGKSFSWNEWGRTRTRSLTFAGKHIAKKHGVGKYDFTSPIQLSISFKKWTDDQHDILEEQWRKESPIFKVGDRVEIKNDGEKGTVIEVSENNYEITVKEDSWNTKCIYENYSLKKVVSQ